MYSPRLAYIMYLNFHRILKKPVSLCVYSDILTGFQHKHNII